MGGVTSLVVGGVSSLIADDDRDDALSTELVCADSAFSLG